MQQGAESFDAVLCFAGTDNSCWIQVGKHRVNHAGAVTVKHARRNVDAVLDDFLCRHGVAVTVHRHAETDFTVVIIHLETAARHSVVCAGDKFRHACQFLCIVGVDAERRDAQHAVMILAHGNEIIYRVESAVRGQREVEGAFFLTERVVPVIVMENS